MEEELGRENGAGKEGRLQGRMGEAERKGWRQRSHEGGAAARPLRLSIRAWGLEGEQVRERVKTRVDGR